MGDEAIRFQSLTKRYGEVHALRGVDLVVRRGEVFGFLGPNGAGKTTAIRIMLDLIRATSGHVQVLGFDSRRDSVAVRRRTGYLPGDPAFYERMTATEYLSLLGSLQPGATDNALRDRLIEALDLDPSRRIGTLSRGNRQKVGLVCALMRRPPLVVLDEPTSGLDPLVQETVEDLLREVAADGRTVFFSSHLLAEVEQVCSRVAMLREGRIIDVVDLAEQRLVTPQRISVRFVDPPARERLAGIAGAPLVLLDGCHAVFETHDGIDALIKALAKERVARLESHEPSLEEIFLARYGGNEAHGAAAQRSERGERHRAAP